MGFRGVARFRGNTVVTDASVLATLLYTDTDECDSGKHNCKFNNRECNNKNPPERYSCDCRQGYYDKLKNVEEDCEGKKILYTIITFMPRVLLLMLD